MCTIKPHQPHHGPHGRHHSGPYHHHHHPVCFCSSSCVSPVAAAAGAVRSGRTTTRVGAVVEGGWSLMASLRAMRGSAIRACSIVAEGCLLRWFATPVAHSHTEFACARCLWCFRDDAAPRRLWVRSLPIHTPLHHHITTHSPWLAFRQQKDLQEHRDHVGVRRMPQNRASRAL